MSTRHKIRASAGAAIDFAAIRTELAIPTEFPADAIAEAKAAARTAGRMSSYQDRGDDRDLPLVTIDPPDSMDLDQAVHIGVTRSGFRVHYAIADTAAFIAPGGALDAESKRRGMTHYSPDLRTPLYPPQLSEGAASLLPDADRPAVLWTIDLDERGEPVHTGLRRTVVRSRAKLNYASVQADANLGSLHPSIAALPRVGALRLQAARRRHAIDLDIPDAEVVADQTGHWTLARRSTLPVEQFNAQISLLTGICAAQLMLGAGVGILRTLPPPSTEQVAELHRSAGALGISWPDGAYPGDVVSVLESSRPREAAFIEDAVRLLRGAGYAAFDGAAPQQDQHCGLAAAYAHVTAPLRRLVDRFGTEVCLAVAGGMPVPQWARDALPDLPGPMAAAAALSGRLDRACEQAVSEFLLAGRVGEVLTGIVVQLDRERGRAGILLDDPPVRVRSDADGFVEGARAAVRLTAVDSAAHRIDVAIVT